MLRVIYRSADATNGKPRPEFYSKHTALLSLLRAAEAVSDAMVQLVFVNDGPLPADVSQLQRLSGGQVVPILKGTNRGSYRAALSWEQHRGGHAEDLVWFAEDDYLYLPGALQAVIDAARARPDADYFAMYGSDALHVEDSTKNRSYLRARPGADLDRDATPLPAARWYRGLSTTSTFGVRRGALIEDLALLRHMPSTGGAWDRATCLAVQGYRPFPGPDLVSDDGHRPMDTSTARRLAVTPRELVRGAVRAATNLALARRPAGHRIVLASDPELIRHMEIIEGTRAVEPSTASQQTDWQQVADNTVDWARSRGLTFPAHDAGPLLRHHPAAHPV